MKSGGAIETHAGRTERSTHADAARQAVALLLVAKMAGDAAEADRLAQIAARAVDAHLAELSARRRRLS